MNKFLKITGFIGLAVVAGLVAEKVRAYCPMPLGACLVGGPVCAIPQKDHPAVQYQSESHAGPFTDSKKMKVLKESRDALAALPTKVQNEIPENINYVEHPEKLERVFTLGQEEGNLVPFSKEYEDVINSVYLKSQKDEKFTVRFFGSTYGLGARGKAVKDGSKNFGKDDIIKLKNKL